MRVATTTGDGPVVFCFVSTVLQGTALFMISASNICLAYGKRIIFNNVNIKFTPGNCYGPIGANGAGKSTFLKILAGDVSPDKGEVSIGKGMRMAVLRQDQFAFDDETVFNTVIMGHEALFKVMNE